MAGSMLQDFRLAREEVQDSVGPRNAGMAVRWELPHAPWVRINVDTTWKKGEVGLGVVLRDSQGTVLASMADGGGELVPLKLRSGWQRYVASSWGKRRGYGGWSLKEIQSVSL